jgi:hypothetical protein
MDLRTNHEGDGGNNVHSNQSRHAPNCTRCSHRFGVWLLGDDARLHAGAGDLWPVRLGTLAWLIRGSTCGEMQAKLRPAF